MFGASSFSGSGRLRHTGPPSWLRHSIQDAAETDTETGGEDSRDTSDTHVRLRRVSVATDWLYLKSTPVLVHKYLNFKMAEKNA